MGSYVHASSLSCLGASLNSPEEGVCEKVRYDGADPEKGVELTEFYFP